MKMFDCIVCGHLVADSERGRPREYHPACREFRNHLQAMLQLSAYVRPRGAYALRLRRQLFNLANEFPVAWARARDGRGRFRAGGRR